jgi:hypothetical protein
MSEQALVAIAGTCALITIVLLFAAVALRGQAERWAILGLIVALLALFASIAGIVIQHEDAGRGRFGAAVQPNSTIPPGPTGSTGNPPLTQYPGVTSLPPDSPLRKKILSMDDVCGELGYSPHAWLPGQTVRDDYSGRVLHAPGAAFTWSCEKDGIRLTRDQITRGCQIWYSGTKV